VNIRSILRWDSIVTQVLLIIILLTTAVGGVSVFLGYFYIHSKTTQQIEDKVTSLIDTIEPSSQVALYINDSHLLKEIVEGLSKNPELLSVGIYDTGNQLIAGSENKRTEPVLKNESDKYSESVIRHIFSPFNEQEKIGEIHFAYNWSYVDKQAFDIVTRVGMPMLLQSIIITLVIGCYLIFLVSPKLRRFLKELNQVDISNQQFLNSKSFSGDYEVSRLVQYQNNLLSKFYGLIERERILRDELSKERKEIEQLNQQLEYKVEQRTRELLLAKNTAEAANRVKSEFLASMSHELRTPLNAILGFAQILELDDLTPDQVDSLHHISQGGEYLLTLVNDVLDFAKIEAHELTVKIDTINANHVITHCCDTIMILAEKRQISLDFSCSDEFWILAEPNKLRQVLLNLLSNAVKYNCDNGNISLLCEAITPETLRISVTDTGQGIAPEKSEHLFKPFSRLGLENSNIPGTGLGLSITQHLVKAMDGDIGFMSQLGQGSTFWVEFPLSDDPEPACEGAHFL
jgi:signal transduction histidine kinase